MRSLHGLSPFTFELYLLYTTDLEKWQESRNGNLGLSDLLQPLSTQSHHPPPPFTFSCAIRRGTWPKVVGMSWNSRRSNQLILLKHFLSAQFKIWITLNGSSTLVQPPIRKIILTTWKFLLPTLVMKGWWLYGQSLPISHTGFVSTLVPQSSFLLSKVLVVPGITKNLISISQLIKQINCHVIFDSLGLVI